MEAMNKALHHRVTSYGPGGYLCPCCGPSQKDRQKERRILRKRELRLLEKIEQQEQQPDDNATVA
jgi:hypothetical protein